jgi:hypothetical protein
LHYRNLELADLVALGQVGVEVVLARKDAARCDVGANRQAELDGAFYRALFMTGSVPGRAKSTAQAWVLGFAPKAVLAREKIFDWVESWAWVSKPMMTS